MRQVKQRIAQRSQLKGAAAIAAAAQQEPTVVGKPSTFMLEHICDSFGIGPREICMVGDREHPNPIRPKRDK